MIKISVVIPVFNCEASIEPCVRSVLDQTLEELEVVCVNDGSTDRSVKIIRYLMAEDGRITLLEKENQGAGSARNLAMENARGKYIAFLDADDCYLEKDALEKMYHTCEEKQVAVCVSQKWCVDDCIAEVEPYFLGMGDGTVIAYQDYQMDYNFMNYLFRRALIRESGICFPLYRRFEDPPFLARILYEAGNIAVADTCLYRYRLPDAVSRFCPDIVKDLLRGIMDNLSFAAEHDLNILYENTMMRLEYEYLFIIFKNMVPDDLGVLGLLMRANQMADRRAEKNGYIIRPLRTLLLYAGQYEKKLLEKIRGEKGIFLYGAGWFGQIFFRFLKKNNLSGKVVAFVVSDKKGNEEKIEGTPVLALRELQRKEHRRIFVTTGEEKHGEIAEYLEKKGYRNYELVREEFLCIAAEEMNREERLCRGQPVMCVISTERNM